MLEPRQSLGSHTFPHEPEVGFVIEIDDEQYEVTEVYLGSCHVRPTNLKRFVTVAARAASSTRSRFLGDYQAVKRGWVATGDIPAARV
jgi:hypothetical protein